VCLTIITPSVLPILRVYPKKKELGKLVQTVRFSKLWISGCNYFCLPPPKFWRRHRVYILHRTIIYSEHLYFTFQCHNNVKPITEISLVIFGPEYVNCSRAYFEVIFIRESLLISRVVNGCIGSKCVVYDVQPSTILFVLYMQWMYLHVYGYVQFLVQF